MTARTVEAGETNGFSVVNIFPETCTVDEWTDFADSMSSILNEAEAEDRSFAK